MPELAWLDSPVAMTATELCNRHTHLSQVLRDIPAGDSDRPELQAQLAAVVREQDDRRNRELASRRRWQ
jgi:hypothetical protein